MIPGESLPIEIEKIKLESRLKARENENFKLFLKNYKSSTIDEILHRISKSVASRIDCTQCGNCCKTLHPALREDEIEQLAEIKKITAQKFKAEFLEPVASGEYLILKQPPCIFLDGKICSIYSQRPDSCGDYPHLNSEDLKFRMHRILDQYEICPIVFHTLEGAKKEMGFEG